MSDEMFYFDRNGISRTIHEEMLDNLEAEAAADEQSSGWKGKVAE